MATVTLTKPIQAHGNEISELELREPNTGDIAACGSPFSFTIAAEEGGGVTIVPHAPALVALIARLANIPLSSVRSMAVADTFACLGQLVNFLGPSIPGRSSNGASTLHGFGSGSPESPSASPSPS